MFEERVDARQFPHLVRDPAGRDAVCIVLEHALHTRPDTVECCDDAGAGHGSAPTASGVALPVHRSIADPGRTDIAIVPSLLVADASWHHGRYPDLVAWLQRVHREGALVCSACSGVLLIAETGLLARREATIHPAYAPRSGATSRTFGFALKTFWW